jgi:hypothetical protein
MHWNIGGALRNLDSAILMAKDADIDVLAVVETWLVDNNLVAQLRALGFEVLALNRDHDFSSKGRPGGGVLVIAINKDVRLRRVRETRATATLTVSAGIKGGAPIALTVCYVPDKSAIKRKGNENAIIDAHASITEHVLYAKARFAEAVLLMDANATLLDYDADDGAGPRRTRDGSPIDGSTHALRALISKLGMTTAHGWASTAHTTSRQISIRVEDIEADPDDIEGAVLAPDVQLGPRSHGREVDYIWTKSESAVTPISNPLFMEWRDYTSHRPLAVSIPLRPPSERPKTADKRRKPTNITIPPFSDRVWRLVGNAISEKLVTLAPDRSRPFNAPPDGARCNDPDGKIKALHDAVMDSAKRILTQSEGSFDAVIRATDDTYGLDSWHSGPPIPRRIILLLRDADKLRLRTKELRRQGYSTAHLEAMAKAAQKSARRLRLAHLRTWNRAALHVLESQRRHDAKRFHRTVKKLAPVDGVYAGRAEIPDTEDASAVQTFLHYAKSLYSTVAPCPPGPSDPAAMDFVPQAQGGAGASLHLQRPITPAEVYNVLFPASKDVRAAVCPHNAHCRLCSDYNAKLDAHSWRDDSLEPTPIHKPSISPSTAAGPDGMQAQLLRWSFTGVASSHEGRKDICRILSEAFTASITSGQAPEISADNRSLPLYKEPQPGHFADPADPKSYRFITIGNVIAKVFDLVLTARLTHWAVAEGLLGPEQVGYLADCSAEMHVFSLVETVKHEWRHNRDVYALFVDLRKAYDMVHPNALSAVLTHMGVPPKLVELLNSATAQRRTTISINGDLSDPIDMTTGLGQGSTLSPVLFILFLESMNRRLRSDPRLRGVTIGRAPTAVRVLSLFYCDDICVMASSPEELNIVLEVIQGWCVDFGMPMGTGTGKTEAMHFPAPLKSPPPSRPMTISRSHSMPARPTSLSLTRAQVPPTSPRVVTPAPPPLLPLRTGDITINWVKQYKYLGLLVTPSLRFQNRENAFITAMNAAFHNDIMSVEAIRQGPALMISQMYKTMVLSKPTYLLGVIEPSDAFCDAVDSITLRAARLMLPGSAPSTVAAILWAESGLNTLKEIALGHRARLSLHLRRPLQHDLLASKICEALTRENGVDSWTSRSRLIFNNTVMRGPPAPIDGLTRAATARGYGLKQGVHLWLDQARSIGSVSRVPIRRSVENLPIAAPAAAAYVALCDSFQRQPLPPQALPSLGELGPGAGGLLANCSDDTLPRVHRELLFMLRDGRRAFFSETYSPHTYTPASVEADTRVTCVLREDPKCSNCSLVGHNKSKCAKPLRVTRLQCSRCKLYGHSKSECNVSIANRAERKASITEHMRHRIHGDSPCPLCQSDDPMCPPNEPMGVAHLFLRCRHPSIVARRELIIKELPMFAGNLVTRLEHAQHWVPHRARNIPTDRESWSDAAWTAHDVAQYTQSWKSGHGAFVLLRALLAAPWTSFSIDESPDHLRHGLARVLATEMDKTRLPSHRLRGITKWWLQWAGRRAHSLCMLWKEEVEREDVHKRLSAAVGAPEFIPLTLSSQRTASTARLHPEDLDRTRHDDHLLHFFKMWPSIRVPAVSLCL